MRAIDLFCCEGGATRGLQQAGFKVLGVDIKRRGRYCGDWFIEADALSLSPEFIRRFDFAWASPPCQAHVSLRWMYNAKEHADLIPQTRELLKRAGVPYAMENVPGAPLDGDLMLCGTMFDLGTDDAELWRHRHFELSWTPPLFGQPQCRHKRRPRVIGVYGGHGRDRRRRVNTQDFSTDQRREAMGIAWMSGDGLSEAIPPAYSEFIARAFLSQRKEAA